MLINFDEFVSTILYLSILEMEGVLLKKLKFFEIDRDMKEFLTKLILNFMQVVHIDVYDG